MWFFLFLKVFILVYVYGCLHTCKYVCALCDRGGQKGRWDLELELQMVVSNHVGARNRTLVLSKSTEYHPSLALSLVGGI